MIPLQHRSAITKRYSIGPGRPLHTMSFPSMPRENQRNYVFVDEHNRHKRLKVMRACEGCRRRKIKCDAATTNTWPCSACQRLKLHCVPPMVQYDRSFHTSQQPMGQEMMDEYDNPSSGEEDYAAQSQHQLPPTSMLRRSTSTGSIPLYLGASRDHLYRNVPLQQQTLPSQEFLQSLQYGQVAPTADLQSPLSFQTPVSETFSPSTLRQEVSQWPEDTSSNVNAGAGITDSNVNDLVGQLKIEDTGVASYIMNQGQPLQSAPAYSEEWDEYEEHPVYVPGQHDFAVRIKPEDMPSDEEAEELFRIFFTDIHPYIPIVNKALFYAQWHNNRNSMSPLLLETIFACAGRVSDKPTQGLKWISLASRHAECFFDVPRLSTVQALLLLLKARETAPQRGYFFRSYLSMVTMLTMAKDLKLHKHAEIHKTGGVCNDSAAECMTKTRVWAALFVLEFMIYAPQGRHPMIVIDPETVHLPPVNPSPDFDSQEVITYTNFACFVSLIKTIRFTTDVFLRLRATNSSWAGDPEFLRCLPLMEKWKEELPEHLKIEVPTDLNAPMAKLMSHYVGNLNLYGELAKVMFHRPALSFAQTFSETGQWKLYLQSCYDSSRRVCRIVEQILDQYEIRGLQCMLRGINFTIYAMLTCTMVNLVAATCPDPSFNADAREYFTRSMRILERCIDISASSETKGQIEALRLAFSEDVSQPFVLNNNFPFYSSPSNTSTVGQYSPAPPPPELSSSPVSSSAHYSFRSVEDHSGSMSPSMRPPKTGSPVSDTHTPLVLLGGDHHHHQQRQQGLSGIEASGWNPSRIFHHWNTGFPGIASAPLPSSTLPTVPENELVTQMMPSSTGAEYLSTTMAMNPAVASHVLVSPDMWQDTIAQVFSGTKRSWRHANQ